MTDYFKCLEDAPRDPSSGINCWSCFHSCPNAGKGAVKSCFACLQKMSGVESKGIGKAYYCDKCHCNAGGEKAVNPTACEACVYNTKEADEDKCIKAA
jgi:hypothetical protein